MSKALNSRRLVKIYRYDPSVGGNGHFDQFDLNIEDETKTTILDLLIRIQKTQDPTLAFRYACRVNMCGSCGMVINGCEALACKTNVSDLPEKCDITIRPLNHFPVIKDLVVDMKPFFQKLEASIPYFDPVDESMEPAVIRPDSKERNLIGLATECIQCGCCVSSCTMVNYHENYAGPAALNRAFTLLADSRDGLYDLRMNQVLESCYHCRTEFNCTEVCPKEISPTRAIKYIQLLALKEPRRLKRQNLLKPIHEEKTSGKESLPSADSGCNWLIEQHNRRKFLKQIIFGIGTASALVVGGVIAAAAIGPSLKRIPKRLVRLDKLEAFPVGKVSTIVMNDIVPNGFYKSEIKKPVIVVRRSDPDKIVVFNTSCTHLGCTVHWDESKKQYMCACHGGAFDEEGNVTAGPPPRPLDRYAFKVEDGYLFAEVV
ncbi:MAG: Rieske 2Fe-2S domain-containing protein [Proteobacteria bacterium]|nr:Rieske 2Fe-2S domain-containing protein [Pseudomonadota bacterium]MBU1713085.1 Rieske 2Fe-2S domain-containing protein [Pseudomonadota bacterium]